jgi:hypothetical protein
LESEYPDDTRVREPILQQHLLELKSKLDLNERIYKTYWALVLMLFFVVGRKTDHLPSTRSGFDEETDSTRADARYVNDDLMIIEIKQTKTRLQDRNHPDKPLVRDRGNPLCPVSALED